MSRFLKLALGGCSIMLLQGCVATRPRPPHGLSPRAFTLPPIAQAVEGIVTVDYIEAEVESLQPSIGRYPPVFKSEEDREEIYSRWSTALVSARSLVADGGNLEGKLYLLSELYRQGHNLDVTGAAEEAMSTVERCIATYPRSSRCHLSASFFYLSTSGIPDRLGRAERSLSVLRELAAPALDDDAEAGFVWLAIYRQDEQEASRLIEAYLKTFPATSRAAMFRKIQNGTARNLKLRTGP